MDHEQQQQPQPQQSQPPDYQTYQQYQQPQPQQQEYQQYNQQPQQQPPIQQQPGSTMMPVVGPNPMRMTCLHCYSDIVTTATGESGTMTWLLAVVLFIFCWPLCLCFLPFCGDWAKDMRHHCPACGQYLGVFKRL